jgi:hypothetical protein
LISITYDSAASRPTATVTLGTGSAKETRGSPVCWAGDNAARVIGFKEIIMIIWSWCDEYERHGRMKQTTQITSPLIIYSTSRAQRIFENEMGNHLLPHHSRRANWKTDALHSFPLGDIYVYTADSFQNSWNKYATERARRLTYIYNKLDVGGCWGGRVKTRRLSAWCCTALSSASCMHQSSIASFSNPSRVAAVFGCQKIRAKHRHYIRALLQLYRTFACLYRNQPWADG